jgi:heme/copper-type cytochrome/quinol oxidase subunit 4
MNTSTSAETARPKCIKWSDSPRPTIVIALVGFAIAFLCFWVLATKDGDGRARMLIVLFTFFTIVLNLYSLRCVWRKRREQNL